MIANPKALLMNRIMLGLMLALAAGFLYNFATRLYLREDLANVRSDLRVAEGRLEQAETNLRAASETNAAQSRAIAEVERLREIDGTILKGLVQDLDASRSRDRVALNRIATLEKTNEQVREYLNAVPPAAVSCVLDKTCNDSVRANGNSSQGSAGGATATVRPAGAGAKQNQR